MISYCVKICLIIIIIIIITIIIGTSYRSRTLETCFAWAGNQDDHKHPKLAGEDLSTFSENISAREGKNLFLRMCTLHAVMTRKPLFYRETKR